MYGKIILYIFKISMRKNYYSLIDIFYYNFITICQHRLKKWEMYDILNLGKSSINLLLFVKAFLKKIRQIKRHNNKAEKHKFFQLKGMKKRTFNQQ